MSFTGEALRQVLEGAGVDVLSVECDVATGVASAMVKVGAADERFETHVTSDAQEAGADLTHQVDVAQENDLGRRAEERTA
jgi:predicted amino acid-binding ACT domain protein